MSAWLSDQKCLLLRLYCFLLFHCVNISFLQLKHVNINYDRPVSVVFCLLQSSPGTLAFTYFYLHVRLDWAPTQPTPPPPPPQAPVRKPLTHMKPRQLRHFLSITGGRQQLSNFRYFLYSVEENHSREYCSTDTTNHWEHYCNITLISYKQ